MATEEKLKQLLERYYNGDTSDEEEDLLKKFFTGEDLPPGYETEREIFRYFSDMREIVPPSDDLESRITGSVNAIEIERKFRSGRILIVLAAASLLLLLGSYFFFTGRSKSEDTFSDPQIAYIEARKILYNVSAMMNEGTKTLQNAARMNSAAETGFEAARKSAALINDQMKKVQNMVKAAGNESGKKMK